MPRPHCRSPRRLLRSCNQGHDGAKGNVSLSATTRSMRRACLPAPGEPVKDAFMDSANDRKAGQFRQPVRQRIGLFRSGARRCFGPGHRASLPASMHRMIVLGNFSVSPFAESGRRIRPLKDSVQRASLRPACSMTGDKVTHRLAACSGGLPSEPLRACPGQPFGSLISRMGVMPLARLRDATGTTSAAVRARTSQSVGVMAMNRPQPPGDCVGHHANNGSGVMTSSVNRL